MKQPVSQRKLIINNRNSGYFITQLKIKLCADVSLNRNLFKTGPSCLTLRGATSISIYFSLHMKVKCIFYAWVVLPRYRWRALHW